MQFLSLQLRLSCAQSSHFHENRDVLKTRELPAEGKHTEFGKGTWESYQGFYKAVAGCDKLGLDLGQYRV